MKYYLDMRINSLLMSLLRSGEWIVFDILNHILQKQ